MVAQVSHDFVWVSRDGRFSHEEFVSNDHKNVKNVGDKGDGGRTKHQVVVERRGANLDDSSSFVCR